MPMDLAPARWNEWFTMGMLVFTLGAPVFFLLYFFRKHTMDDPDCSKYNVFTTDPGTRPEEHPNMPASCQPSYLQSRPWWNSVNTTWLWVSLGIGAVWLVIMVVAFLLARMSPEMRQALPM